MIYRAGPKRDEVAGGWRKLRWEDNIKMGIR
jgi:hypothetical protein